jgi:hypothetical protein
MAELDTESNAKGGAIVPLTKSPLDLTSRQVYLKSTNISSSVFNRDDILISKIQEDNTKNLEASKTNQESLISIEGQIQGLRDEIVNFNSGLTRISTSLQRDSDAEISRIREDQEKERRLSEQQVRFGRENKIEQKIQAALVAPVQRLQPQVQNIFERIGTSLTYLFGGWLTNQVIDYINAQEKNDTDKLTDIKTNILKNVGFSIAALAAIKIGFNRIISTIISLPLKLTALIGNIIKVPFKAAGSVIGGLTGLLKGKTTIIPKLPSIKPSAPLTSIGNILKSGAGAAFNTLKSMPVLTGAVTTAADIASGEKNYGRAFAGGTGAAVLGTAGAIMGSPLGPIGSFIGGATGSVVGGPIGKSTYDVVQNYNFPNLTSIFSKKPEEASSTSIPPTSTPTPVIAPQQTVMGENVNQKENTNNNTSTPPPPKSDRSKEYEMAWQYRNNPFARGKIETAWNQMSPEDQQSAKDWAKMKGYDWNEMKLKDSVQKVSQIQNENNIQQPIKEQPQITSPPKQASNVGVLPEIKPNIIVATTSSNNQTPQSSPVISEPITDVPLINSSNPDNFYVLYSKLQYNVVT